MFWRNGIPHWCLKIWNISSQHVFFYFYWKNLKNSALKENPKFEIKENSSENNQYVNKITLSMQCHKKQFGNNNDVYLSDSELLINLSGNECKNNVFVGILMFLLLRLPKIWWVERPQIFQWK